MAFSYKSRPVLRDAGPRRNGAIHVREVRCIGADGRQLGIIPTQKALELAQEQGLDLVEVSAGSFPPVCRIMDWGKAQYEKSRKEREAARKQAGTQPKEVQFRPNIEDADFEVKAKRLREFLEEGRRCRLSVFFKGREITRKERGMDVLQRAAAAVADIARFEQAPSLEGKRLSAVLAPLGRTEGQSRAADSSRDKETSDQG